MDALPNEIWMEMMLQSKDFLFMRTLSTVSKGFRKLYEQFEANLDRLGYQVRVAPYPRAEPHLELINKTTKNPESVLGLPGVQFLDCKYWVSTVNSERKYWLEDGQLVMSIDLAKRNRFWNSGYIASKEVCCPVEFRERAVDEMCIIMKEATKQGRVFNSNQIQLYNDHVWVVSAYFANMYRTVLTGEHDRKYFMGLKLLARAFETYKLYWKKGDYPGSETIEWVRMAIKSLYYPLAFGEI